MTFSDKSLAIFEKGDCPKNVFWQKNVSVLLDLSSMNNSVSGTFSGVETFWIASQSKVNKHAHSKNHDSSFRVKISDSGFKLDLTSNYFYLLIFVHEKFDDHS